LKDQFLAWKACRFLAIWGPKFGQSAKILLCRWSAIWISGQALHLVIQVADLTHLLCQRLLWKLDSCRKQVSKGHYPAICIQKKVCCSAVTDL